MSAERLSAPLRLDGGTAVITGAASGIGLGLARHAAQLGMRLLLADVDAAALKRVAEELGAQAQPTDVRDPEAVAALADRAFETFDSVDVVFNNAGVMQTGFAWEIPAADWQRCLEVNLHGAVRVMRAFMPRLLAAARPAQMVNTASIGGMLASPLMAPYAASKAALVAVSEAMHGELAMLEAPVGVSLLAPGPVKSGIFDTDGDTPGDDPRVAGFRQQMQQMLEANGLAPEAFAERVFEGLAARGFWLIPQPEIFDAAWQARADGVLARRDPELPNF
jgi:NAD(P)-dependent dehydrogenase (short-subunit alcohol dehydrogenase family)